MKDRTHVFLIILLFVGIAAISGCNKDELHTPECNGSNPTYDGDIKTIVDSNCVSCHSNYSSYSGLNTPIGNGDFRKHVLTNQTMPRNSSLTNDQLDVIQCWVDNGYPEN